MTGLGDLAGGAFFSEAYDVSNDGSTVVGTSGSASGTEAFRWTQSGGMLGLGDLTGGDFFSEAFDISNDGSIVVGSGSSASGTEAFIWDASRGMRSLQDLLVDDFDLDLTGWTLDEARGISADGLTIVGRGINPSGSLEAWIATVPEPHTLTLLAFGGLVLAHRRRRRVLQRGHIQLDQPVTDQTTGIEP